MNSDDVYLSMFLLGLMLIYVIISFCYTVILRIAYLFQRDINATAHDAEIEQDAATSNDRLRAEIKRIDDEYAWRYPLGPNPRYRNKPR